MSNFLGSVHTQALKISTYILLNVVPNVIGMLIRNSLIKTSEEARSSSRGSDVFILEFLYACIEPRNEMKKDILIHLPLLLTYHYTVTSC